MCLVFVKGAPKVGLHQLADSQGATRGVQGLAMGAQDARCWRGAEPILHRQPPLKTNGSPSTFGMFLCRAWYLWPLGMLPNTCFPKNSLSPMRSSTVRHRNLSTDRRLDFGLRSAKPMSPRLTPNADQVYSPFAVPNMAQ